MAKVLYPNYYEDIDLKDTTHEFYNEFYHIDLNDQQLTTILNESGLKEKQY